MDDLDRNTKPNYLRTQRMGRVKKTIARLNDEFRATFEGGKVLITAAVNALSVEPARSCNRRGASVQRLHER